jgi:hypothetical protein
VSGQFQVISATYTADGAMQTFAVQFEQHCEGAQAALHGEFDWRLNDKTPRAPWMEPGPASSTTGNTSPNTPGSNSSGVPTLTAVGTGLLASASNLHAGLVKSLTALLARQSRREAGTVALFAKQPTSSTRRQRALAAINRLRSLLATARREISSLATPASARRLRARVISALAAWQAALAKQRAVIAKGGGASRPLLRRLSRAEAARAASALASLRRFR